MIRLIGFLLRHFFSSKRQHFLILLQNNNELRSTGGYITSVFEVELGKWKARKKSLDVATYLTKHAPVPAPKVIEEMLFDSHLKTWTFRDSNYDPDFNKSAKKAIDFYHMVYPKKPVCGLLMVNFGFTEGLLKIMGPVRIGQDKINQQNLFLYLTTRSSDIDRHDLAHNSTRKNILGILAKKLVLRAILRPWKWFALWSAVNQSFKDKSLQFYDPKRPQKTGFAISQNEDFLAIIENNYLGLKSNRYIKRDIQHDSELQEDGKLKNTLNVSWRHLGVYDYPLSGHYKGHIRFYLPREADVQPEKLFEIHEEGDFKILSFKLNLPPREIFSVRLTYELPINFAKSHYRFHFFKQPGVVNEDLEKTFSLPLTLSYSEPTEAREQVLIDRLSDLSTDVFFEARFTKSKNHPRIYAHHIVGPKQILLKFNEAIVSDPNQEGAIVVHEKGKPKKKLKLDSAKLLRGNRWLLITLNNLPDEREVFYSVILNNFHNQNGIQLKPNPRIVTVVYRPEHFGYWKRELPELVS